MLRNMTDDKTTLCITQHEEINMVDIVLWNFEWILFTALVTVIKTVSITDCTILAQIDTQIGKSIFRKIPINSGFNLRKAEIH